MCTRWVVFLGVLLMAGLLPAGTVTAQAWPPGSIPAVPGGVVAPIAPPGQPAYCLDQVGFVAPRPTGCAFNETPIATPFPPGYPSNCRDWAGMVFHRPQGCLYREIPEGAVLPRGR